MTDPAFISFKYGSNTEISNTSIQDGQMIVDITENKLYVDLQGNRICLTGSGNGGSGVVTWEEVEDKPSNIGSDNKPIYINSSGEPVQISYEINKSVPSDAIFTDTTYSNASTTEAGLMSAEDKSTFETIKSSYAGSSSAGGAATVALKLSNTVAVGSSTQPVYFTEGGIPTEIGYTILKSVPANAEFTDTTYSTATTTVDGLLSSSDKTKIDTLGSSYTTVALSSSNFSYYSSWGCYRYSFSSYPTNTKNIVLTPYLSSEDIYDEYCNCKFHVRVNGTIPYLCCYTLPTSTITFYIAVINIA